MKKINAFALAILCCSPLLACCGGNAKVKEVREIPLEDFFRKPEISSFRISPSGEYYSYRAPYETRMNIFVQKVGEDEPVRITDETDRDIAGYLWANDNRILYLKDTGGDENYQLYGVNIDGTDLRAYTAIPGVRTDIIDDLEDVDEYILIGINQRNPQVFDPYRLNVNTGEMKLLYENPGNILGWMTDNEGKLRVAYVMDGVNNTILYRDTEEEDFRPVLTTSFKESLTFYRFTPDNKYVYAISNIGRDKDALVIVDPATAQEKEFIYANDKYDLMGMRFSKKREVLEFAVYYGHKDPGYEFFDSESENLYKKVRSHFDKNLEVSLVSRNRNEDIYVVATGSDKDYGAYYVYDTRTDELTKIADMAPWIDPSEMADMIPVTYTTRDGLEIEAYLTLPAGYTMKNARNLPVVVNPHGGPWARDYWGYNPEVQFLANRGYAVLQMNFRGSTGFGREFWEKSFKQWGLTMQDDITDGVQWLIDQGIADPDRIAIYGGSYGGYATLAGITKTPELYAAAVDYVGVSNLFTFLETIPPYWKPMLDMMYEMVGHPDEDKDQLTATSPALNADKIVTPLFVVQGANDPRVNKDESDQMVAALRERGVEVDYLIKYDEGHGFRNQENVFEMYRAMEKFLAGHLLGDKTEPAAQ
ncbi:MAG: S9 family peptidase [Alistipes sp.]|nr:S9 family peptidase [Alistipes sp.]